MPSSILNSDDGVISGTAGLKNSGGDDAVLLIQTKGVTAATVSASQVFNFVNPPTGIPSASPGGSTTQVQFNNAGAFGGISGVTTDGTRMTASTTIGVGGATPSTSGSGISFPATQSASTNANTLDDYEEGTFTPVYAPSSGSFTSVTYESQNGNYVKIGRVVFYNLGIGTTAITVGTASGEVQIGGFPFTVSSTNQVGPVAFAGRSSNFAGEEPFVFSLIAASTSGEVFYKNAVDANFINLAVADLGTGATSNRLVMNGFYYA